MSGEFLGQEMTKYSWLFPPRSLVFRVSTSLDIFTNISPRSSCYSSTVVSGRSSTRQGKAPFTTGFFIYLYENVRSASSGQTSALSLLYTWLLERLRLILCPRGEKSLVRKNRTKATVPIPWKEEKGSQFSSHCYVS